MESANAIELKKISKYFGEVIANKNISLEVRKGEILSLLGENGSGKTTLMNMLMGFAEPDSGKIEGIVNKRGKNNMSRRCVSAGNRYDTSAF